MTRMKPLASLSSQLLARKGQARPAMRNQAFALSQAQPATAIGADDLGWNDMGGEASSVPVVAEALPVPTLPVPTPPVLTERATLRERLEIKPVSSATAARIGRDSAVQTRRGKAAFTLRLDAERHLRLRLASAVANRSAQALVADALDAFLNTMPEVEALIEQLPAPRARRTA
ncbi:hypothetical protein [Sphingomonas sp. Leaf343]|uniref:hypothetical protein n=1 Tax=Sphingomonas sp. Leaf343 TaxID=1736345 RepID=UPI00144405BA|nr:hypothetical protein [Sphingomonas sp. Leaf343]